ncbi:MAG TPA: sugar ABC transporter permease [Chthonomonadaceae bacterium]|nr:sugar ABC transporter permease [Chthonomonadaceae bacterium]
MSVAGGEALALNGGHEEKLASRKRVDFWAAMLFLLPNLLGFLVFTVGPVLFSLVVSFSNWRLQRTVPFSWIGFANFSELFHTEEFWLYAINTVYLMIGIPISIAGSLALALLLNQKLRGMIVYRTLFYLPSFTAGVALYILWKALYNPEFGPLNALINGTLQALHLPGHAPQWLASTHNVLGLQVEHVGFDVRQWGIGARDAILLMGIWVSIGGGNMLLYLAGLSNIPQDLYDAGQVDGAGKWATFRHIIWPQLAPTTFFIVIMSVIGGLQGGFEQARVMTTGGPAGTTQTISYYIYTKAFEQFQIGYASAVAWILFVVILVGTLVNWKFGSQHADY